MFFYKMQQKDMEKQVFMRVDLLKCGKSILIYTVLRIVFGFPPIGFLIYARVIDEDCAAGLPFFVPFNFAKSPKQGE